MYSVSRKVCVNVHVTSVDVVCTQLSSSARTITGGVTSGGEGGLGGGGFGAKASNGGGEGGGAFGGAGGGGDATILNTGRGGGAGGGGAVRSSSSGGGGDGGIGGGGRSTVNTGIAVASIDASMMAESNPALSNDALIDFAKSVSPDLSATMSFWSATKSEVCPALKTRENSTETLPVGLPSSSKTGSTAPRRT